jgi:hypothetical protein
VLTLHSLRKQQKSSLKKKLKIIKINNFQGYSYKLSADRRLLLNNGESLVKTDQPAHIKYKTYRILIAQDVEYLRCILYQIDIIVWINTEGVLSHLTIIP